MGEIGEYTDISPTDLMIHNVSNNSLGKIESKWRVHI